MDYSQNDPRWKNDWLGLSRYWRMGPAGCYVTAMANVATALGHNITPGELNQVLTAHGLINGNGDVVRDDALSIIFPDIEYVERRDWPIDPAPLDYFDIRNDLNTEIIIMIDSAPATAPVDTHFMRVIGRVGADVLMVDSWDGVRKYVSSYGRAAADNIYQAIKYRKKSAPATAPVPAPAQQGDDEMLTRDKIIQEYRVNRGADPTEEEIQAHLNGGTMSSLSFGFAAENAAKREAIVNLQEQHARLQETARQLVLQVEGLSSRPTPEELATARQNAQECTTKFDIANDTVTKLQQELAAKENAGPVIVEKPAAPKSFGQTLLDWLRSFGN